jgi:hypothetical protein
VPRSILDCRLKFHIVAVAPMGEIGQQVSDNQERLFFVPD